MLDWLVGLAQAALPDAPLVVVPSGIGPYDAYWLAAGGALGAFSRALWIQGQKNLSLESAQDTVLGLFTGLLWNLSFTIPGLGIDWPLVPLPVHATEIQRAAMLAVITMVTTAASKRLLFTAAPAYMDRLTGGRLMAPSVSPAPPGGPMPPTGGKQA